MPLIRLPLHDRQSDQGTSTPPSAESRTRKIPKENNYGNLLSRQATRSLNYIYPQVVYWDVEKNRLAEFNRVTLSDEVARLIRNKPSNCTAVTIERRVFRKRTRTEIELLWSL